MLLSLGAEPFTLSGIRSDILKTSYKHAELYDPYSPFWLALGLHYKVESRISKQRNSNCCYKRSKKKEKKPCWFCGSKRESSKIIGKLVHHPDDLPITHGQKVHTMCSSNHIPLQAIAIRNYNTHS